MNTVYTTLSQFTQIPEHDIGQRMGLTGYIDFIEPSDFEGDIRTLKGRDMYGRAFFSILYDVNINNTTHREVGTIFERYSDSPHALAFGSYSNPSFLWDDSRVRTSKDLDDLVDKCSRLLTGEKVQNKNYFVDDASYPHVMYIASIRQKILDDIKENCTLCDDLCGEVMQYI